jgi:transcriptional regulator with XRE-family HTH domain
MIFESTITQKAIGKRIAFLRGKKGLTPKHLSELSGVAVKTVAAYEKGTTNMGIQNLSKIVTAFGISMTEFFRTKPFARTMRFA